MNKSMAVVSSGSLPPDRLLSAVPKVAREDRAANINQIVVDQEPATAFSRTDSSQTPTLNTPSNQEALWQNTNTLCEAGNLTMDQQGSTIDKENHPESLPGFTYQPMEQFALAIARRTQPIPLDREEIAKLAGVGDALTLSEVSNVYVPLCQELLSRINAHHQPPSTSPTFAIGIAGGVAVGKSTTARVIHAILKKAFDDTKLVTTDNFLYSNATLQERNIMHEKGFPNSFDTEAMVKFLQDLQDPTVQSVKTPIYSHKAYNIVEERQEIGHPKILVLEGLNILQEMPLRTKPSKNIPDDLSEDRRNTTGTVETVDIKKHIHFSLFVNATLGNHRQWYTDRFLQFCQSETAFKDRENHWHKYSKLSKEEATATALSIYDRINGPNLERHIFPTRLKADLILEKGGAHQVSGVQIRN